MVLGNHKKLFTYVEINSIIKVICMFAAFTCITTFGRWLFGKYLTVKRAPGNTKDRYTVAVQKDMTVMSA